MPGELTEREKELVRGLFSYGVAYMFRCHALGKTMGEIQAGMQDEITLATVLVLKKYEEEQE